MWAYLESLKPLVDTPPKIGKVLKQYKSAFDEELRPRHRTTHDRPYHDIVYDRLWRSELMGLRDSDAEVWRREHLALYRRETRRWADRAQRRSRQALVILEAAAVFTLNHAAFLRAPARGP